MLKATFIAWQRWGNGDNCLICYNCHAVPCLLWLIALEIHLVLELHTAKCQSRSGQRAVQMKLITELLSGPIDQNPALQFSIPCRYVVRECRTPCLDGSAWYSIWYIKPATLAYIADGITRKCCQRIKSFLFCKEAQAWGGGSLNLMNGLVPAVQYIKTPSLCSTISTIKHNNSLIGGLDVRIFGLVIKHEEYFFFVECLC